MNERNGTQRNKYNARPVHYELVKVHIAKVSFTKSNCNIQQFFLQYLDDNAIELKFIFASRKAFSLMAFIYGSIIFSITAYR